MLTFDQVNATAEIVIPDVEARMSMSYLDVAGTEPRELDYTRVYRVLVKKPIVHPSTVPSILYLDAVMPEHHNRSGMSPSRALLLPGQAQQHACEDGLCVDSVRLIPVGCEDLLDKYLSWWCLVCRSNDRAVESILIEQDASMAQKQIREADHFPRFIYTDLDLVMADNLVRCSVSDGGKYPWSTPKGEEVWFLD